MHSGILYFVESGQQDFPLLDELRRNVAINKNVLSVGTKFRTPGTGRPEREEDYKRTHASAWDMVDLVLKRPATSVLEIQQVFAGIAPKVTSIKPKERKFWRRFASLWAGLFS
jgi:hypothetical protein